MLASKLSAILDVPSDYQKNVAVSANFVEGSQKDLYLIQEAQETLQKVAKVMGVDLGRVGGRG
jgi:hypothetical protein